MESLRKLIEEGMQSTPFKGGLGAWPPRKILKFGCLKPDSGAILTHIMICKHAFRQY